MALDLKLGEIEHLLLTTPDDTKDAPWMVMADAQWHAVDLFLSILRLYVQRRRLPWYVASYMKITMTRPDGRPLDVAPDAFVVEGPDHWRESYDLAHEGTPPQFVLEVTSRHSGRRDRQEKVVIYEAMGIREYAIFASASVRSRGPRLHGYRLDPTGRFIDWLPDDQGVLWSQQLGGVGLYVEGQRWLRLMDSQGNRLPSAEDEAVARYEADHRAAAAEAEAAQLREALRRLREGQT